MVCTVVLIALVAAIVLSVAEVTGYVLKGEGILYVAERVAANGTREWLCEFPPGDLELVER